MARQLTVRGVPEDVAERLESLSRSRGRSVNSTVLEILKDAVGVHERKKRLSRYATWTEEDLADFERVLADQRRIDEELWR
jgi:plasmid stability protein